jgi:hypothetical protein
MKQHLLALCLLACVLPGCVSYQPLQLEPARRSTPIAPRFSQSYYFYDRDRNLYVVMRSSTTDAATGKAVEQVATIRVFWRPRGGVTTLDAAALNATFRYVVMTPDAIGMYEGAGFVRLASADGVHRLEARVVDGDLRLTQASANFVDTLGRAHMRGYFSALYDDSRAVDMLLGAHREFFARSLNSRPATMPARTPAQAAEDWGIPGLGVPSAGPAGTLPAATLPAATQP